MYTQGALKAHSRLANGILNAFGQCPRCMRQAFIFMVGAWGVLVVTFQLVDDPLITLAVRWTVIGSTLIWLIHVVTFSVRHMFRERIMSGETLDRSRRSLFSTFGRVLAGTVAVTAIPRWAVAQGAAPKPSCQKDRTVTSNLLLAQKSPSQKGTVGIITVKNVSIAEKKADVDVAYVDNVTYKEAADKGESAEGFFWVPNSVLSYQDILAKKKPPGGEHIMSCCASGGCSRCCPSGGCICYTTGSGNCFCSSC